MLPKLLGLLALVFMLAIPTATPSPHAPAVVASMATQPLAIQMSNGSFRTICTAVAISEHGGATNTLITAQHCLLPKFVLYVGEQHAQVVQVVARDRNDTAVLRTRQVWQHSLKLAKRVPFDREHVMAYGFPRGLPMLYREGVFAGHYTIREDMLYGRPGLVFSINQGKGDSGSAIMSSKAEVFCVLSFGLTYMEGFSVNVCVPPAFTPNQLKAIYGA